MTGLRSRSFLWLGLAALPIVALMVVAGIVGADRIGDYRWVFVIGGAVCLVVLAGGWAVVIAPLEERLSKVVKATQRLAAGALPNRIDDPRRDEIALIGGAVDQIGQAKAQDRHTGQELEERIRVQATQDSLTGLLNRSGLVVETQAQLDDEKNRHVSAVFVDIDDFRLVNELFGYDVGDEVLVAVGNRLRRTIGDNIVLGRWSSDQFLVVLANVEPASLSQLASQIRGNFDQPVNTSAGPHPLACSVGWSSGFVGSTTANQLLNEAEEVLQSEKRVHERARSIDPETARLVELALSQSRLEVWYQPIVELQSPSDTQMVGAEAFVRLRDNDNTVRVPSEFLGEIMTSRYAREIDKLMAQAVLSDLSSWQGQGLVGDGFFVSLNLSPASLRDDGLGGSLMVMCAECNVSPESIVLDVSEEAGEVDQIIAAELRQFGFRLSIDDLGFKRSNFDRLFNIGAEFAKLHPRWLDDDVMLEALVSICQKKNLVVVAEAVETMEQLELLFSRGVRLAQGYLISRPIHAQTFLGLLGAGRNLPTPAMN